MLAAGCQQHGTFPDIAGLGLKISAVQFMGEIGLKREPKQSNLLAKVVAICWVEN